MGARDWRDRKAQNALIEINERQRRAERERRLEKVRDSFRPRKRERRERTGGGFLKLVVFLILVGIGYETCADKPTTPGSTPVETVAAEPATAPSQKPLPKRKKKKSAKETTSPEVPIEPVTAPQ